LSGSRRHTVTTASVVVITYRRPDYVRTCLQHLAEQTVKPVRVIVVDSSPDTATRDVVRDFPNVEYRRNDRGVGTMATSRAIGITDLEENVVAFVDDDAFAEPLWLEKLLEAYADPDVVAAGGRALNGQPGEADEGIGEIGLLLPDGRLTGFFAADPAAVIDVDHMLGANMSYRLDAIRSAGGIRDFYPGTCLREDSDMALRLRRNGGRIVYTPFAVVKHVGGTYARGRRFDSRYRYFGARNHVVLLATTLGWRDPHVRRYTRTALRSVVDDAVGGVRNARNRSGLAAKASALAGGARRSAIGLFGTGVGFISALRAQSLIKKTARADA
jgi:GT2 family glycosyltransferase